MKVDILIKGSQVFNVYQKSFELWDVAIIGDTFAYVGKPLSEVVSDCVIDGRGKYLIPGLVDIHLHIESTMLTPIEFSTGIIAHGTTTAVTDPHEIANVFGLDGVETMMAMQDGPADIFYGIPSSVPSTPFETTGGNFGPEEVQALLRNKKVVCLGEVMNFHDLIAEGSTKTKRLIEAMHDGNTQPIIEGHCPKLSGLDLQKFLYAGVDADHTQQTVESLLEKINAGMFIEIQGKSLSQELVQAIVQKRLSEHCCLVTDDTMVDILQYEGHLSRVYRQAVEYGLPVEEAIYMSTYTPARRMKLTNRGSIAPGRLADFLLVQDIEHLASIEVYKNGKPVVLTENTASDRQFPEKYYRSVNLEMLLPKDFEIFAPGESVVCRMMEINSESTFTEEKAVEIPVVHNNLDWESQGVALVAVFDRYNGKNKSFGFVSGTCLNQGAVATTYAHDHHNLMVVGMTVRDMVCAANRVIGMQGGMVAVRDEKVQAEIPLPVAGILSDAPLKVVADQMKEFRLAIEELGWKHHNPIMSLGTLSLPVSPALKITDQGLVDVRQGKVVPLIRDDL